ncbi:MAG: MFS transporter [Gammaproteobacteria bacterium]|nr:MFS transporter [Gammaproteobacteria bacterium]MYL00629.1 MFS transporter [Gammaproteobacteria bacterium]
MISAISRMGIFYGWILLLGLFLIYMASNGILINTMPLIFPEIQAEFGLTKEQTTRPANVFFFLAAVLNPLAGYLLDKFSVRWLMLGGSAGITVVLVLFPFVQDYNQLMALYILFALSLSLSGLGPSLMLLSRWFVRYRGIAFGILLLASSFGGFVFPEIVKEYLPDWRSAVIVLAVIGGALLLIPALFLLRDYPSHHGLAPDGVRGTKLEAPPKPDSVWSVLKGLAISPVFYLLAFSTGTLWFCIVAMLNNQGLYLRNELALDTETAARVYQVFFVAAIIGKLLFGYLADKFDKLKVMLASVVNLGVGLGLLMLAVPGEAFWPFAYALVYGVGYAGAFTMIQLAFAEFYAGRNYGKILGIFICIDSLAGFTGGTVLAASADRFGTYAYGVAVMTLLCVAAVGCILALMRFKQTQA